MFDPSKLSEMIQLEADSRTKSDLGILTKMEQGLSLHDKKALITGDVQKQMDAVDQNMKADKIFNDESRVMSEARLSYNQLEEDNS